MTEAVDGRAITDPIGLITELVTAAEPCLPADLVLSTVLAVSGGRAKARRLASALAARPEVLVDGRSPAPRAVGELLRALCQAGATAISPLCCVMCEKPMRTFIRRGQHWYCSTYDQRHACCAACGMTRRVKVIDRDGQPRCDQCSEVDDRDPISVIYAVVFQLDPRVDRDDIAEVVNQACQRRSYQQSGPGPSRLIQLCSPERDIALRYG